MATSADARAVKSLNTSSSSRKRFTFKSFSQRIEEIDIDVYRSLEPLKAEPSKGSTFFRDCLVEYRELNTAEEFISFYEEMFPLVQTLPQIILQKDLIISSLLTRLKMKGRLSHEPILRLIAALSRDLLEDFVPFLQAIADTLGCLLESGADRDPEIIEQIFTSWSYILMNLQKYLIKDAGYVLRITANLRYYSRDYVREFMAESVSFLFRKTPIHRLKKDIRRLMVEVVEELSKDGRSRAAVDNSLEIIKSGAGALLSHVVRITSSRLHSNAEVLMPDLMDDSFFNVGPQNLEGSGIVLEVLILAFQRLYTELDPVELSSILTCICGKITDCAATGNSSHLTRLLSLLVSVVQNDFLRKLSDYKPMVEVVGLLVKTCIIPSNQQSEVIDKVMQLVLCVIDCFSNSSDMPALRGISSEWEPVFSLRSQSLLTFIKDLLKKDPCIFHVFETNIICALNNLIEIAEEEVVYLIIRVCEKMEGKRYSFSYEKSKEPSRIHVFMEETLRSWIGEINDAVKGNSCPIQFQKNKLAVLWGVVGCYSQCADGQVTQSLLMDLIDALDKLLMVNSKRAGFSENCWQSLIGAALRSYHKLVFSRNTSLDVSVMTRFLDLAKRYKSSPQILSAVADILDLTYGSEMLEERTCQFYLPERVAGTVLNALDIFAENLSNANKEIRLSTLRILCHFEPLRCDHSADEHHAEKKMRTDVSKASLVDDSSDNVLNILRSIEATSLSIATSRRVILLISRMQMSLTANRVASQYIYAVLYGLIGIFHNRFSHLWGPASECLAILVGQYHGLLWDRYIQYLDHFQSVVLESHEQLARRVDDSNEDTGLVELFNSDVSASFDSTPSAAVLSLLIQTLQKVRTVAESRSRQLVPLFLKFLGYDIDDLTSVELRLHDHKGKDWKGILKEWLSLFRLLQNPKAFYQSQFFKNVLQSRLLDESDADIQMKVLDCLLNWRDDFLLPYSENLKNLINAKYLREELTRWSLSRRSENPIDVRHRSYVVPIVIQLLIPKVRNLKMLACQKNASVPHRKAVLGFVAQLDIDELSFFFCRLIKPLVCSPQGDDRDRQSLWTASENVEGEISHLLKYFTVDSVKVLSWKKRFGFLHVVEDILAVFDESHLYPFLDLLLTCVVRILASCSLSLDSSRSGGSSSAKHSSSSDLNVADLDKGVEDESLNVAERDDGVEDEIMASTAVKQFKDVRSLCLKIISIALSKYEDHEFGDAFWNLFFTSIKPLIDNFKQEGASSKNPSSLFHCFLAMSTSRKLVELLFKEQNLVPDIFSILTLPSASESILSCVFKFTKNLLKLDNELGSEDSGVKRKLLPHFSVLICSMHTMFTNENSNKRKLVKFPGKREFTILKLLSKYVKGPSEAKLFIDILLPLLTTKNKNSDTCADVLQTLQQVVTVLGSGCSKRILKSVTPLLISAGSVVRTSICDVLDAVSATDSSVIAVAKLLRELNATLEMEVDAVDYDKVICAYDKINVERFYTIPEEHTLIILAHSVHDMSSQDLILRQSAFRLLLSFVEFSGQILNGVHKSDLLWSESSIQHIVNNFLLKHMGNAMGGEPAVQKVWLDLFREMVLKLPGVANLESYRPLCSDDAEQDFFSNVVHLQKHRRARALSRFGSIVSSGNLSEVITSKVFVPLLFRMLFDVQDGKDEHIRSACIGALGSVSGCMKWNQYYALLIRCFRDLTVKPDKQKILMRLICSILDHYHFSETSLIHETNESADNAPDPYTIDMASSLTLRKCSISAELPDIQMCLQKKLLPKVQKLLSDSDNINVNISLVALKILKLLPGEIMDSQLPTIIHRISNFLKHRLESVREEARTALAACLKELGLEYLQFIVKVLKGTLKRGFELHVLGYTLNFMLSKFLMNPICGKLDYCLEDLLFVVENDILGGVSEEKEVEKIASKMKETRKQKSYETLKLIAQSITFKTYGLKLLSPVTKHLGKQPNQKMKSKLESMLSHIAAGIECNPSVDQTELFIFTYSLIEDGIADEVDEHGNNYPSRICKSDGDDEGASAPHSNRLITGDRRFSHLITAFALGVMHNYMKNLKLNKEDTRLLSLLDPFVRKLDQCLSSKYDDIITAALKCLSLLVRLPLPSLQSQADKIKNSLLDIAQGSVNTAGQLIESCVKLLTTLLRSTKVTLSADQLNLLLQFPLFVDLARNPSFVALSLLKAIVNRKLVVPEIYDIVQIVAELMVQSQLEPVRKKCSQILLQFLLGYHLSEKRLQQHLDFLLTNLRYEHSTGREAVLEMLHAIIMKFPRDIIDGQSLTVFLQLVVSLVNDDDSKVRSMTAAAIKCLIGRVSKLDSILEYSQSWYIGEKQNLWSTAAQVLGLLVEVMGKSFKNHLSSILQKMKKILKPSADPLTCTQQNLADEAIHLSWKEPYYSLVMFEKILHQFPDLFFDKDLEEVWEYVCQFLLHQHLWLRHVSSRILSLYYAAITDARKDKSEKSFSLMKPSKLFLAAVSFCCQLKVPVTDDAFGTLVTQNLVFSICGLHSILENNESMGPSKFWSNLELSEQDIFREAFGVLDPRKGRKMLEFFTSEFSGQNNQNKHPFISYLLQRMVKTSFQMEASQIKIVFNCFKLLSPRLLTGYQTFSPVADDTHGYAYQMLLPLYRVQEGYTGSVVTDDLKQLAQEVSESIRDIIGMQNFVQIYSNIRKNLKVKRDKRKHEEKIMAVVNPTRNAKRKLRIAAKHQANKKRKIITMKMGRWMH